MNPHIELVKKWLADSDSVSLEELKENKKAANAAYWAAYWAADDAYGAASSANAAYAAYWAVDDDAYAYAANAADAAYWAADDAAYAAYWRNQAIKHVKKHEEFTK